MYLNKYIDYIKTIDKRKDLQPDEKEIKINEMKTAFVEVANISSKIVDAKFGIKEYGQKEYDSVIDSAIKSAHKIDVLYKEQFGIPLFAKAPQTASDVFDLSVVLNDELLEDIKKEGAKMKGE